MVLLFVMLPLICSTLLVVALLLMPRLPTAVMGVFTVMVWPVETMVERRLIPAAAGKEESPERKSEGTRVGIEIEVVQPLIRKRLPSRQCSELKVAVSGLLLVEVEPGAPLFQFPAVIQGPLPVAIQVLLAADRLCAPAMDSKTGKARDLRSFMCKVGMWVERLLRFPSNNPARTTNKGSFLHSGAQLNAERLHRPRSPPLPPAQHVTGQIFSFPLFCS